MADVMKAPSGVLTEKMMLAAFKALSEKQAFYGQPQSYYYEVFRREEVLAPAQPFVEPPEGERMIVLEELRGAKR